MVGSPTHAEPVYGLTPPTLADAYAVVAGVYPDDIDTLWPRLLDSAGLAGDERTEDAVARIVDAMASVDRVLELCALSLTIRRRSHEELSAAHTTIERAR